mmetsp:Transcript_33552/g.77394  ORF Transcript_33552/g.77394 Transcript_33552/m.77394 type:complete len:349 (-) Transcript_33552:117-1163(-)
MSWLPPSALAAVLVGLAVTLLQPQRIAWFISQLILVGILSAETFASWLRCAVALAEHTRRIHLRNIDITSNEVLSALGKLGKLDAFIAEDCTVKPKDLPSLCEALTDCPEMAFVRCPLEALPQGLLSLEPRALRLRDCQLPAACVGEINAAVRTLPDVSASDLLAALPTEATPPPGVPSQPPCALATKLKALDLSANILSGAGLSLAQLLRHCKQIQLLQMEDCALQLEDVNHLARALPRSSLIRLDLAGNSLRGEGLQSLARSLPGAHVQDLGLERNGIAVGDLSDLKRAFEKRPFPGLRLEENQLSDYELGAFIISLEVSQMAAAAGQKGYCPAGCKCFEGRGEVM